MGVDIFPVTMDFSYRTSFGEALLPDAYERLLLDVINGDPSLFTRNDEIELAWSTIDPIIEIWEGPEAPPSNYYKEGTLGPEEADKFIAREHREWLY